MFAYIIGSFSGGVDWPATVAIIGISGSIAAIVIAWFVRTPVKLQEMKLQTERDLGIANVERQRAIDLAKIDQKVITSHRSDD